MSADETLLRNSVAGALATSASSAAGQSWPDERWERLADLGLHRLGVDPAAGGSGGDLSDLAVVIRELAARAVSLPVAEMAVAGSLCRSVGWHLRSGLTVVAGLRPPGAPARAQVQCLPSLVLGPVPWARFADQIMVLSDNAAAPAVALLDPAQYTVTAGANLAGEPRDEVTFTTSLPPSAWQPVPAGHVRHLFQFALTLQLIAVEGAVNAMRTASRRHAAGRVQFGRPLSSLPAVQDLLARLAAMAETVHAAAQGAMRVLDETAPDSASWQVIAAKLVSDEAAGRACSLAHQLHGAIGLTAEHHLQLLTRRLWSWRDELSSAADAASSIGTTLASTGARDLWPFLAGNRPDPSTRGGLE